MTPHDVAGRGRHLDPARRQLLARLVQARELPKDRYPVSATQFGIWLFDQLHPGSGAYHNPAAVLLDGVLDLPALEAALGALQERHAALRTRFVEDDDGLPWQVIG
jgi:hypothetical protein